MENGKHDLGIGWGGAERPWVVFDLETTGLARGVDEIIQIAGMRVWPEGRGGGGGGEVFFTYVDPGFRIPAWITGYTGVRDEDVRGAPGPGEALRMFSRFVGEAVLVAHNGHRFDMPMIAGSCDRHGLERRQVRYYDSLALSWQVWGRRGVGHGLDRVMERLGLREGGGVRRHDARGDVMLLSRAVVLMVDRLRAEGREVRLKEYVGVLPEVGSGGEGEAAEGLVDLGGGE